MTQPVLLQTTVSWDRDSLVCVQEGEKEGRGWTHWLEGDKLHLVRIYNWGEKRGGKRRHSGGEHANAAKFGSLYKKRSLINDPLCNRRL